MAKGEGKGWSKGRTAATDPRVARGAAAHLGQHYVRRTPPSGMRWVGASQTTLGIEWSSALAYVVGLTATDGCLLGSGRGIVFTSKDRDLVELYLRLLGRENAIRRDISGSGAHLYRTTFKDSRLYSWFLRVGLMPRKSFVIGAIDVPDDCLAALVRGLLDGDGSISNGVWRADTSRRSDYFYESLRVRFCSASRNHVEWLHAQLTGALGLRGWITTDTRRNRYYTLAYGKHDSIRLLGWIYADPNAPALLRKHLIWESYRRRHASILTTDGVA
jgi:hypothetical protein